MRNADRKESLAAALLLLAGLLIRVALSRPSPPSVDGVRFLAQAHELSAGARAVLQGDPFTVLPPGYPLFIRAVGWIRAGVPFLLEVQFLLSVGTLALAWLAVRRQSREAALIALALLAFNPWLARQQALVMSETLGAFLLAVTAALWPVTGRPLGAGQGLILGALAVVASLVTPAAAFIAVPCLGVLAWQNRSRMATLSAMAAGLGLVLFLWQAYLLRATGRVEPWLLHPARFGGAGMQEWLRTWATCPEDKSVWWSDQARHDLPPRALGQGSEPAIVQKALEEAPFSPSSYVVGSGYDKAFQEVARDRIREHPVLFWIGLSLTRSATLWLDYRAFIGIPAYLRHAADPLRLAFWATHAAFWAVNLVTLGLFAWGAVRAVRSRDALLMAILVGTVVYSLTSAATARGEFRRNLTLYPALAVLLGAGSGKRPAKGRGRESFRALSLSTESETVSRVAEAGVDDFIVHPERKVKAKRQSGADTQINHDMPEDLRRVQSSTDSSVLCRVNRPGPWTPDEFGEAVGRDRAGLVGVVAASIRGAAARKGPV